MLTFSAGLSRKLFRRGSTHFDVVSLFVVCLFFVVVVFLCVFLVDEEREDPNTTKSGRFAGGPMIAQY